MEKLWKDNQMYTKIRNAIK